MDPRARTDTRVTPVAVVGSCVTRDVFNSRFSPGYRDRYRVTATGFRLSLPSVTSPPVPVEPWQLDGPRTAHQRERLELEFARTFTRELAADPPAVVLVDFLTDARLGVVDLGGGSYLTANTGMLERTAWWKGFAADRRPRRVRPVKDPAGYLAIFEASLRRFTELLAGISPSTRVVHVRVRHTAQLWLPGVPEPVALAEHRRMPPGDARRVADALVMLDERAAAMPAWTVVDMRERDYPSSDTHPWTAGPAHFAPEYYRDLLTALDTLVAGDGFGRVIRPGTPGLGPGGRWDDEQGRGEPRPRAPQVRARGQRPTRRRATARSGIRRSIRRRLRRLIGR